jgi:HTH-type transcriptional regulator, sugar sensing transcriptional regulator
MSVSLSPQRLTEVGLSKYEAGAYLALLGYDDSTAVEVADRAGIPRQRIYDVLDSLRAKEMTAIRNGRPVRHTARPPARALPAMLVVRQRQQAAENARLEQLVHDLVPDIEQATNGAVSLVTRVLRASEESTLGGF